jgi:hypothetical protein
MDVVAVEVVVANTVANGSKSAAEGLHLES